MALSLSQFVHTELAKVYFGNRSPSIPVALHGRCQRLLDSIEYSTKPDDTNIAGNGFQQAGGLYSLAVDGAHRITYQWRGGKAADIDYV